MFCKGIHSRLHISGINIARENPPEQRLFQNLVLKIFFLKTSYNPSALVKEFLESNYDSKEKFFEYACGYLRNWEGF